MTGYLNGIILTAAACQIAQMITYNTESYRRIVHVLCALAMLLTMIRPVRWITENMGELKDSVTEWMDTVPEKTEDNDPMYDTAQAIMEHAVQRYHFEPEGMKVTLISDDDGVIREIQLYPEKCAYSDRIRAESELSELYGIPVYIYNRRE